MDNIIAIERCANCGQICDASKPGSLMLNEGNHVVAAICIDCTALVLSAKLVIRRKPGEGFEYEQFSPLEVERK